MLETETNQVNEKQQAKRRNNRHGEKEKAQLLRLRVGGMAEKNQFPAAEVTNEFTSPEARCALVERSEKVVSDTDIRIGNAAWFKRKCPSVHAMTIPSAKTQTMAMVGRGAQQEMLQYTYLRIACHNKNTDP